MEKLPKEFKANWVKMLRSGEYKQGEHVLYNKASNTFCCLGVAGVLCGIDLGALTIKYGLIPTDFVDGEKIPPALWPNNATNIHQSLANLNDSGVPFEIIAGVIDEYL